MAKNKARNKAKSQGSKVVPFWETKTLEEMSREQWESLCDGCAKCCLHKFIDDPDVDEQDELKPTDHIKDHEQMVHSSIVCHLLNDKTCQCTQYEKRTVLVPDCVRLTQDNIDDVFFMPPSCTYRRLKEGRGMPSWHPLLNGGKKTKMHAAGMSVRGKVVKDNEVSLDDFEKYIVTWPLDDID
ncbi:YcgN family cysteine cluster protein [Thalassotalea sp. LPB0316]|uniref:YcgN family cysteine cluster protein n=1 Tax=Thalassotalea sp. LPB0316 TaxID=2769490 RepID=UPI0018677EF7|nr:YcgN family cysteine cluster protein [Thalassotalea sp. LPB0316]QOL24690.1 YcgN family cysteine cluster protein [Thalassotalea sp. LPB0316]